MILLDPHVHEVEAVVAAEDDQEVAAAQLKDRHENRKVEASPNQNLSRNQEVVHQLVINLDPDPVQNHDPSHVRNRVRNRVQSRNQNRVQSLQNDLGDLRLGKREPRMEMIDSFINCPKCCL